MPTLSGVRHCSREGARTLRGARFLSPQDTWRTPDRAFFDFPYGVSVVVSHPFLGCDFFSSRFVEMYFSQEHVALMAHFRTTCFVHGIFKNKLWRFVTGILMSLSIAEFRWS